MKIATLLLLVMLLGAGAGLAYAQYCYSGSYSRIYPDECCSYSTDAECSTYGEGIVCEIYYCAQSYCGWGVRRLCRSLEYLCLFPSPCTDECV